MQRRSFLQQAGLILAASGGSFGLSMLPPRQQQAWAASTSRKLALLIGINQYPDQPLAGCLTDVALQRELLVSRFGFAPDDILTLVDQQATQAQISAAFAAHLQQQAKAGDVVVIHFSGYGRLAQTGATPQMSLLTADRATPDLVELSLETLGGLVRSLPTRQVTTILDAGVTYGGTPLQGNFRVRARPPASVEPLDAALLTPPADRALAPFPGVVLTAAVEQLALEAQWDGFSAGLLTYALTQHLWQTTSPTTIKVCFGQTAAAIALVAPHQMPQLGGADDRALSPYYLPLVATRAEGVITAIEDHGKVATVWLGGLAADVLALVGSNSSLALATDATVALPIVARAGLMAKMRLPATPTVAIGEFVQEVVRLIPRQVELAIALDPALERIERIDATSAFDGVARIALVATGAATDYLFSKVPKMVTQVATLPTANFAGIVPPDRYGLFAPDKNPLINTTGEPGEAIKLAVRRLVPQLQTLLAAKLLHLLVNDRASRLGVRATLALAATPTQLLMQQATTRGLPDRLSPLTAAVPIGSRVQYQLQNLGDQPIYFMVLGLDSDGKAFYYAQPATPTLDTIAPNAAITLPPSAATAEWTVRRPIGQAETYLICSLTPFTQTQALLSSHADTIPAFRALPNPLEAVQTILQDLDQGEAADVFALNMHNWATLRFVYQVV